MIIGPIQTYVWVSRNQRFWHKQLSSPGTPDPPLLRTKSEGVERSELNGIQSRLSARGHQEYKVYCRSRSGSSARTTHRSACTSCSSERVRPRRLAMASLVRSQSRSQGCNSGQSGREKDKVDALQDHSLLALVPACPISHEHDAPMRTSADPPRAKCCKGREKTSLSTRSKKEPVASACFRTEKPIHVKLLLSLLHTDDGTVPFPCPDSSDDWLETDAMLAHAPEFYRRLRIGALHLSDLLRQLALQGFSAS